MTIISLLLIVLIIIVINNYPVVLTTTISSLSLFFNNLFPSLFLLLVLFKLLLNKQTYSLIKHICPLLSYSVYLYTLTGIIMGFAGNTLLLNDAYNKKQISNEELEYITNRVCLPSATFIIFSIGTALSSYRLSTYLFIIQVLIILLFVTINPPLHHASFDNDFKIKDINKAFISSGNGLFMLFCYVTTLSCISAILTLPLSDNAALTVLCFSEFASSTLKIAAIPSSLLSRLIIISAILGFGSISTHIQIKVLADYSYHYQDFLKYRIIQCLLSILLSTLLIFFL
ncbi:MAG: hypothetical protein IKM20_07155 [Erysipelotrichales bacterium]|nr:hypothetical protein [Erysipelotrichales bacterium]